MDDEKVTLYIGMRTSGDFHEPTFSVQENNSRRISGKVFSPNNSKRASNVLVHCIRPFNAVKIKPPTAIGDK
jgi:hypothetical protein